SPDGTKVVTTAGMTHYQPIIFDVPAEGAPPATEFELLPSPAQGEFWPTSWSQDGRRIVGAIYDVTRESTVMAIFTVDSGSFHLPRSPKDNGSLLTAIGRSAQWMTDDRRVMFHTPETNEILLYDTDTGTVKKVLEANLGKGGQSLAKDNTMIVYGEFRVRSDVWLLEPK
ncbi:MAG: hypothetical protein IH969_00735, partial [Candidatus Krumholzibacteriota bacterium]|nr:hypothetical protein [Candidatus Krumholzibacteriota bacterium]